ncbi:MAG TPA: RNA polymerase sigma factor [Chloroflexia bacterium]|nr:RNA polymerase sigma factor [Chloroflexia bacterium]
MSEADLISRARRGDEAAWEALVREHQEPIFRLAYLLLSDAHDAEDVAQETFIRAFRALHTFDTARSLRPWLLTITSNLSHNKRRSLGRYLGALRRVYAEPEPVAHIGERSAQQWEAETLWQAVKKLNPNEQEVVYLRYFLEMSEAEMASTLQVAPGTVKSRLHRAMNRLRAVVDQEFPALREERQA